MNIRRIIHNSIRLYFAPCSVRTGLACGNAEARQTIQGLQQGEYMKGLTVSIIGAPFYWMAAPTYPIVGVVVYVLFVVVVLVFWTGAVGVKFERN